jgi:hypothetical protein
MSEPERALLEREQPWLLHGRMPAPSRRKPAPQHASKTTYVRARDQPTTSGRHRLLERRLLNETMYAASESGRRGPCEDRHLPLARQRRAGSASPQRTPQRTPWLPTSEWRTAIATRAPVDAGEHNWAPVPLNGFAPNVVDQCTTTGEGVAENLAQPQQHGSALRTLNVTGGGWAAEVPDGRRIHDEYDGLGGWTMGDEVMRWHEHARSSKRPPATLAIVERFLESDLAKNFLPDAHEHTRTTYTQTQTHAGP